MKHEPTPTAAPAADPAEIITPSGITNPPAEAKSTRNSSGNTAAKSRTRRDGYDAEDTLQITVAALLDTILPPGESWWCHVPNGGNRSAHTGARLKRMGTKAGAPDCMIIYQGKAFWIELKSRYGSLQDSQRVAFPKIMAAGSPIAVARTLEEVVAALMAWGIPTTTTLDAFRIRHGLTVAAAKAKKAVQASGSTGTIRLSSSEYRAVMALGDDTTNPNPNQEETTSWQTTKPAVSQRRFWRRRKKSG